MTAAQESKDKGGVAVDLNSTVHSSIGQAQNIVAEEWAGPHVRESGPAPSVQKLWGDRLAAAAQPVRSVSLERARGEVDQAQQQ